MPQLGAFLISDKTGALHRAKIQVWLDLLSSLCDAEFHPESRQDTKRETFFFYRDRTSSQPHFCQALLWKISSCLHPPPPLTKRRISREDRVFSSLDLVHENFFQWQPSMVLRFKKQNGALARSSPPPPPPWYAHFDSLIDSFHQFWTVETSDTTSGDINRWFHASRDSLSSFFSFDLAKTSDEHALCRLMHRLLLARPSSFDAGAPIEQINDH